MRRRSGFIPRPVPCSVPLVEEGWLDHPVTRLTAQEYLGPVLAEHIDTLVLGCTHYRAAEGHARAMSSDRISDSWIPLKRWPMPPPLCFSTQPARQPVRLIARLPVLVTDVPLRFQSIGEHPRTRPAERGTDSGKKQSYRQIYNNKMEEIMKKLAACLFIIIGWYLYVGNLYAEEDKETGDLSREKKSFRNYSGQGSTSVSSFCIEGHVFVMVWGCFQRPIHSPGFRKRRMAK